MKGFRMRTDDNAIRPLFPLAAAMMVAIPLTGSPAFGQAWRPECGATYPEQIYGGQLGRYSWEMGAGADCVKQGNKEAACTHFRAAEIGLNSASRVMMPTDVQDGKEYLARLFSSNGCKQ
jgi:hypothetical protein